MDTFQRMWGRRQYVEANLYANLLKHDYSPPHIFANILFDNKQFKTLQGTGTQVQVQVQVQLCGLLETLPKNQRIKKAF